MNTTNYLVEFVGTLIFAYVIIITKNGLVIGLTLAILIIMAKNTSGGHFNPAISLAMANLGSLNIKDLIPYIVAQVAGALVALKLTKIL